MNEIKNKYHYVLTDRFGSIEVAPLNEGDFKVINEQEKDGKYFYSKTFSGKIVFTGTIFQRLHDIERSMYICADCNLKIYRNCGGTQTEIFDGNFKLTEGDWDLDRCMVTLKFEKEKPDRCFDRNKSKKLNLLSEISNKIIVKSSTPNGTIVYKNFTQNGTSQFPSDYWGDPGDPYSQNWTRYYSRVSSPDGTHHNVTTRWARELVTLAVGESPEPGWVFVSGTTYAKPITTINCYYENQYPGEFGDYMMLIDCDIAGYSGTASTIDNGVLLSDVINLFKTKYCPDLTVVSDFFQINPENVSNLNYVTGLTSEVNNLVLFQKSDVKRPTATGNASKAELTFEQLTKMLFILYNVNYGVYGNVLRFEHFSWFSRTPGLDLTAPGYQKYVKGKRKYSYVMDSIPIKEVWAFKEQANMETGEINYTNLCSSNDKENQDDFILDFVTGDVKLCLDNPSADSNRVTDDGLVIIATRKSGSDYYMIGGVNNTSLRWTNLIPNYHYYNRPLKQGVFNGNTVTFISTKPALKGEKITVPLPCGIAFDPMNTIKTALGVGVVESSTFRLRDCMLDLDILYNVFDNLSTNSPPSIEGGISLYTYADVAKNFPVVTSDSDGTVVAISVKYPPSNGTIDIISLTEARYTPNPGFVGMDFFGLKATDDWGENSPTSQGNFAITIRAANNAPIATNDNYIVYQELAPFTAVLGVTNNDSDDWGFTLLTTNVTTAQGVAITLNSTGNFVYTPPPGFIGNDTFQYQIQDDAGLISTGTVTLSVSYRSYPVAVTDNYSTIQNNTLSINGTSFGQQKITLNDYTPDGSGGAIFSTAETKPTAQGGNVTIQTNGLFSYTPPPGYVGNDSFTYTANNSNGSSVGTVNVAVIPPIFVRLVLSDQKNVTKPKQYCDGLLTPAGSYQTRDYTVYFYSDLGGTIPVNVDANWGLRINYRDSYSTFGICGTSSGSFDSETNVVSGTSHVIYNDFVYYDNDLRCDGNTCNTNVAISLLAGGYIVIS